VRLMQRRYFEDDEVKDRAPARGQYWVPPLGQDRQDGALEPPPPLILPPPTPVEAQAAQPEHERDEGDEGAPPADDQGGNLGVTGGAADAGGEEPVGDDGWVGDLSAGDEPDVDR